ncbi:SAR2788 family putative toxin [Priestia aryabhattai]
MKSSLFKQIVSVLLATVLIIGLIPRNNVFATEDTSTSNINEEQIQDMLDDKDTKIENTKDELSIETNVSFDDETYDSSEEESSPESDEPLSITDANVTLTLNHETNEITVSSIEKDEDGNEQVKEYNVSINNASEDGIDAKFIDTDSGESYKVDTNELQASFIWFAIPIGVAIGEALLSHLISIGLATVISGVTYLAISEFMKRPKSYNHYMAYIDKKGKFWVGNGISKAKAISRLKSKQNTWSTSKSNAQTVAKGASPISKAVGPEIDKYGSGKLYHYHPVTGYKNGKSIRLESAHAFYGSPRK